MEKRKILTSYRLHKNLLAVALSMACTQVAYEAQASSPDSLRLIIGITVDGLSMDYIELLDEQLSDSGLKRVLNDGVTFTSLDFGTPLDAVSANALIHTGAAPTINGVPAEYVYNTTLHRAVPLLNSSSPSAADENFSPARLLATTLSDEVRIAGGGLGYAHSVAPDASMAIVAAGHAANSAYWINDVSGKWTTSTYFPDRPTFLQYRNRMKSVGDILDTLTWAPSLKPEMYPRLNSLQKAYPFKVRFPYGDTNRIGKYKSSPAVNTEVTDVAVEMIRNLELGTHEEPDMLSIGLRVQPYPYGNANDERMQLLDGYINLDRNLGRLFKAIEDGPGMDNTLFFIVGTPVNTRSRRDDEKWRIPTGEFSPKKAISLLNLYLINKFGNGEWVSGYHNGYFYLNPSTIAEHGTDARQVREESARFLRKMAGVAYAYTIEDVSERRVHDNAQAVARNTRTDASGDLQLTVAPGWVIVDDENPGNVSTAQRASSTTAPAFLLSPGLEPQRITETLDARILAPTVASVLRIRPPNGASLPPVRLKRRNNTSDNHQQNK